MVDGREVILMDEQTAGWRAPRGYSEDMAHAIALAVTNDKAAGRAYHVAEPEQLTYQEWVGRIGRAAGWEGEIVVLPAERMPEHLKPTDNIAQDWLVDTSRIRDELGYKEQTGQEEGLERAVEWQKANPPEQIDPAAFDYAAEDAALAERG
jgi:nucleoside-diphosphate-sugar epimerase